MKLLIVFASLLTLALSHSPVLLWPAEEFVLPEGQSALDMMNIDDFQKLFDGKNIIVFHKRTFNLEEVSYPKKQLSYLPSVNAIALQGVKSIHRFVGGLTSSENLKFIRLTDGELDEQEDLIKNAMKANPGFAAILVGSGSHRSRRAADVKAACEVKGGCLGYIGAVEMVQTNKKGSCEMSCDSQGMIITVNGNTKITVAKDKDGHGYKLIGDSTYKIDSDTDWAPKGFSYSCGALKLVAKNPEKAKENPTILLKRLQVYPENVTSFPESYDCATWFSSALWMGTLVALFYIFILFGAILFLLDVKTNDRFDDPKGKTITVNVAE